MLKVREVRDVGPEKTVFRLSEEEAKPAAASAASPARLVAVATRLLAENGLPGHFRVTGEEEVTLELPSSSRNPLHDGILFAAADAVNDPVRNPTLTFLSGGDPPKE